MKIAIIGIGGVGGYFGGKLAKTSHHVTFVVRGDNLQAIRERGLQVGVYMVILLLDQTKLLMQLAI